MQVYCLFLVTIMSVLTQTPRVNGKSCGKRLDLVFAVDTTSSQTSTDFDAVKSEVKKIASDFKVDPLLTRMALVSIAKTASVIADFDAVKSLSDFDAAVTKLDFSNDTADLSEGIKVAKDSLVVKARKADVPFILIMVKDRRLAGSLAYDSSMLSRIASEAQLVKSQGATINTLGIGGLWITKEVEAVYGTDYLMFKDKDKALKSIKSFGKAVESCKADCPLSGKSVIEQGMCFGSKRHVITESVSQVKTTPTIISCRSEIVREIQPCSDDKGQRCNNFIGDRKVGACGSDNKLTVTVIIRNFKTKTQKCDMTTINNDIACGDVDKCPDQKADIILVVDRSQSITDANFPLVLSATADLIRYLNIGPNNVKVGVISFGEYVHTEIEFGSNDDKNSLIKKILDMGRNLEGATNTHLGLQRAREQFKKSGRQDVGKYVFLITDGQSSVKDKTQEQAKLLKDMNVALYCIGVNNPNRPELTAMTVPETSERMVILDTFSDLKAWSEDFSKKMCHKTAPPHVKLCEDNVFAQSVSPCESGTQYVTRIDFAFDASRKCVKSTQTQTLTDCKSKCVSPTDGNEYLNGSTWKSLCYDFKCEGETPKVVSAKCPASDGTCMDIGSPQFKCLDLASNVIDNCQCAASGRGNAHLVIDRH